MDRTNTLKGRNGAAKPSGIVSIDPALEIERREDWLKQIPRFEAEQDVFLSLKFERQTWFMLLESAAANGATIENVIQYHVQRHICEDREELEWDKAGMDAPKAA
jgi:hypothetical protein